MGQYSDPTFVYPKRWALTIPEHPCGMVVVHLFNDAAERDAWVAKNQKTRVAVGKRNPEVKKWRRLLDNQRRFRTRKRTTTGTPST